MSEFIHKNAFIPSYINDVWVDDGKIKVHNDGLKVDNNSYILDDLVSIAKSVKDFQNPSLERIKHPAQTLCNHNGWFHSFHGVYRFTY